MATHNRRATTVRSVESLRRAAGEVADLELGLVHVDDGSTDGTAAAVLSLFPDAKQIRGDGSWFWAGAMRRGLEVASAARPDYVLWLNDDVTLEQDAFDTLLRSSPDPEQKTIAAGAVCLPGTDAVSYSGVRTRTSWRQTAFDMVPPSAPDRRADTTNGNVVLVPRAAYEAVGGFDPVFRHGIADYDYGLRATRDHGCSLVVTDRFVGTCSRNSPEGTFSDASLSLRARWTAVRSPKGLPPREWAHFQRRHGGPTWPIATMSPYVHLLLRRRTTKARSA